MPQMPVLTSSVVARLPLHQQIPAPRLVEVPNTCYIVLFYIILVSVTIDYNVYTASTLYCFILNLYNVILPGLLMFIGLIY